MLRTLTLFSKNSRVFPDMAGRHHSWAITGNGDLEALIGYCRQANLMAFCANHSTGATKEQWPEYRGGAVARISAGVEVADRQHVHIAVQIKHARSHDDMRGIFPGAHIEVMQGTFTQATKYNMKGTMTKEEFLAAIGDEVNPSPSESYTYRLVDEDGEDAGGFSPEFQQESGLWYAGGDISWSDGQGLRRIPLRRISHVDRPANPMLGEPFHGIAILPALPPPMADEFMEAIDWDWLALDQRLERGWGWTSQNAGIP